MVVNQSRSVDNGSATSFLSSLVLLGGLEPRPQPLLPTSSVLFDCFSREESVRNARGRNDVMWATTRVAPRPRDDLSYLGIVYVQVLCLARDAYADSCYCNVDVRCLSSTWSLKKKRMSCALRMCRLCLSPPRPFWWLIIHRRPGKNLYRAQSTRKLLFFRTLFEVAMYRVVFQ